RQRRAPVPAAPPCSGCTPRRRKGGAERGTGARNERRRRTGHRPARRLMESLFRSPATNFGARSLLAADFHAGGSGAGHAARNDAHARGSRLAGNDLGELALVDRHVAVVAQLLHEIVVVLAAALAGHAAADAFLGLLEGTVHRRSLDLQLDELGAGGRF